MKNQDNKFTGLIRKKKDKKGKRTSKKYDTLSITMELERPLDIEEAIKKEEERKASEKKRIFLKKVYKITGLMALVIVAIFLVSKARYKYKPQPRAIGAMTKIGSVKAEDRDKYLYFEPRVGETNKGVIVFPQPDVDPISYSNFARKLSDKGYKLYILEYRLGLPDLVKISAADIIDNQKDINSWSLVSIGGSNGAVVRSASELKDINSVAFLGSYPDDNTLKLLNKKIGVLYGTEDGKFNLTGFLKAKDNLSEDSLIRELEGGNHSNFGEFGLMKDDKKASLSQEEQIDQTVEFLNELFSGK